MKTFEYTHLLPGDFSPDSKVWIYQSNRLFTISEALQIEDMLNNFYSNWKTHGTPVKGHATLLFGQFIVIMADETATGVSGCSTDGSVRLIKEIEKAFNVAMFDRLLMAFIVKEKIQLIPLPQLGYALENDFINPETVYFNNLVQTKEDLEKNWLVPIKNSWLAARLHVNG